MVWIELEGGIERLEAEVEVEVGVEVEWEGCICTGRYEYTSQPSIKKEQIASKRHIL
ncbi:hypothetical protein BofuT4_uP076920.1 [Botrytis cinerea T4]|uniref:Uncharacterized protein n=1 Tax=Botryotinia fuckeliana (strain T4) TaxID=999810 RepID=G2XP03_BOTF4|nr:hypothetical protein BofuT4_uP076920.1 [Botrytis cinerea T4]